VSAKTLFRDIVVGDMCEGEERSDELKVFS